MISAFSLTLGLGNNIRFLVYFINVYDGMDGILFALNVMCDFVLVNIFEIAKWAHIEAY